MNSEHTKVLTYCNINTKLSTKSVKQPLTVLVYVRVCVHLLTEYTPHSQLTPHTYWCQHTLTHSMHTKLFYQSSSQSVTQPGAGL